MTDHATLIRTLETQQAICGCSSARLLFTPGRSVNGGFAVYGTQPDTAITDTLRRLVEGKPANSAVSSQPLR